MKETFDSLVDHFIAGGFFLEEAIEILEKRLIQRALEQTGGNRSAASKVLGIHRNTLQRKLVEYRIAEQSSKRKPARSEIRAAKRRRAG